MSAPAGDKIMQAADRITRARRDMSVYGPHECEAKRCQPLLSEYDLIAKNALSANDPVICPSVYVCRYGQIHVCTADMCDAYIGTHTGTCPLTGAYHGHTRGDTGYIPVEKRTGGYKRGDKRVPLFTPSMTPTPKKQREDEEEDGKEARGAKFGMLFAAAAVATSAVAVGAAAPLPSPSPRGGEEQRANMVLSATLKMGRKRQKKPPKEPGVDGAAAVPVRKRQRDTDPNMSDRKIARLSAIAEEIIVHLLYSPERRAINEQKLISEVYDKRDQAIRNYYAAVKSGHTCAIVADLVTIKAQYAMQAKLPHLAVTLKRNQERIERYVKICLSTWEVVIRSPWGRENQGTRFDSHVMSVLYRMRRGMTIGGVNLIPQDRYLFYLPLRIDLPLYGTRYESGIVTNGMKHLKVAYKSAIDAGTDPTSLVLRV